MSGKIHYLTRLGKVAVFVVEMCNSVAAAMVLWCSMAVTLGFGGWVGFLVMVVVLAVLGALNAISYELSGKDIGTYHLLSTLGIIAGQVIGFCCYINFPFVSLAPDSASSDEAFLWYGISMVVFLVLGRAIHGLALRSSRRDYWR